MLFGINTYLKVIKNSSLLNFAPDPELLKILQVAQIQKVDRGEKLSREEIPSFLYLVLEGEISIRSKQGLELDRLKPGRSLELRPLMINEKTWQFDWYAEVNSIFLKIPWAACSEGLKKNPEGYSYLGRMASSVILQKVKRDMRGIGMSYDALVRVIAKLKFDSIENIAAKSKGKVFCIVQQGEVNAFVDFNSQKRKVASYQSGDSMLLDFSQTTVQYQGNDINKLWYLLEPEWSVTGIADEFKKYLNIFNDLAQKNRGASGNNDVNRDEAESEKKSNPIERVVSEKLSRRALRQIQIWKVFPPFMDISFGDDRSLMSIIVTLSAHVGFPMGARRAEAKVKGLVGTPSIDSLEKIALALGFDCYYYEFDKIPENETMWPLVVHLDSGLKIIFATLGDDAIVGDPDTGQVGTSSLSELEVRRVDRRAISLAPGPLIKSRPDPDIPLGAFLKLLFEQKKWIGLFFAAGMLGFLFELILPVLIQYLFDSVITLRETQQLVPLISIYLFFAIMGSWLGNFSQKVLSDIGNNFVFNIKDKILKRVSLLPVETFRSYGTSGILSRINEVDPMGLLLASGVLNSVLSVFLILASIGVLWLYHPTLVVVVMLAVPIEMLVSYLFKSRIARLKVDDSRIRSQENRMLMEHFTSAEDMKSLKGQLTTRWRWERLAALAAKNMKQMGLVNTLFQVIHFVVAEGVKIFCLLMALKLYTDGALSLGQVIGTSFLVPKIFSPLQQITTHFFQFLSIRPALTMINDFIYSPVEMLDESASIVNQEKLLGGIEFQHVNFSYDLNPTLKSLNFKISPGQKIAILGPTGSGKSAVAQVMSCLVEPSSGTVLFDGMSSDQLPLSFIRSSFGMVEQDGALFGGTIIENISLGDPTPDFEKVQRVAEIVEMDDEILGKPGGYDFILQPGGLGVSEGQKQRLIIARALYKEPSILVFDEATSYLDPILEKRIVERILRLYQTRTIIFITHRTHLSVKMDQVLYLENGALVEGGTHKELIAAGKHYYEFYVSHLGHG